AIDGGPPDARRFAANALEQIVGADVPLRAEKHLDDAIAPRRTLTAMGPEIGEIGKLTIHLVNWRRGDLVIESPIHPITNSPIFRYSTEKDCPQPHVDVAFGFLIVKPPPVMVSTKSTSAPLRYRMLIGSMK